MAELRLSTWGIKNPIPVALLFLTAVIAGLIAYGFLPIKQFPNVVFPAIAVTVTESGAAPAEMETQISRPVEDAMAGIPDVRSIQTQVSQGLSNTMVQFELGTDLQKAMDEVRQRVDQTRANLPREIDPPTIQRLEINSSPILTYAVSSPTMSPSQISWFIDDTVGRELQAQKGVAQVSRVGGIDRDINVIVDPDRLAAQGLTANALNLALSAFNVDYPGGRVDVEAIRGVACGETIRSLMEKHLVKIAGRAEEPGRPILYGTTRRFLEVFGLNSLKDLPQPEGTEKKPPANVLKSADEPEEKIA